VDETGIDGTFDLSLLWAIDRTPSSTSPAIVNTGVPPDAAILPDVSGPSIFDAVQEQLGLRLQATKGPIEFLVIDHIEEPSDN